MGMACSKHGKDEKRIRNSGRKREEINWKRSVNYESAPLKRISMKYDGMALTSLIWLL
jgi:hypothetical protein